MISMFDAVKNNDPVVPAADTISLPSSRLIDGVQKFVTQYAASILTAIFVAMTVFSGNKFLPVPWHFDDYNGLIGHHNYRPGHFFDFFATRPVSLNVVWHLGAAGETTVYVVMFLLTALFPVLTVRLALRLYRSEPGPWVVIWLIVAVSFCTVLCEQSPWFYRYLGLMSNMTSLTTGLMAAYCFSRWLDGKKIAFVFGCLLFLATAFAKEDMLLFVPVFVTADWWIMRLDHKERASLRSLALVYGWIAIVGVLLFCWNTWIVPSRFTSNLDGPLKQDRSLAHLISHSWNYLTCLPTPTVAFVALLGAALLGLLRRGHRVAAVASVVLVLALVLPYAVLVKFNLIYCLNWMSMSAALALVGIAVALQPFATGRLAALPWIAPFSIVVAAVLLNPNAGVGRQSSIDTLNERQEANAYILQQLVRHKKELAAADAVIVKGVDGIRSPWYFNTGWYINDKLGRQMRWLVVAKPESYVGQAMKGRASKIGQVETVSEQYPARHPGLTVLEFDKNLNLTIHPAQN